jgi:hypothetical protein
VAAVILGLVGLAGCSAATGPDNSGDSANSTTSDTVLLSEAWQSDSSLTAGKVASDLTAAGICKDVLGESDGVYANDILREFKAGNYIQCQTYGKNQDYTSVTCPTSIYINAGSGATLYDPKRSLDYEDGASVALFYGDNYQVELSPSVDASSHEELLSTCAGLITSMKSSVGGQLTLAGQYESSDSGQSVSDTAQAAPPAVEQVQVPNFVGSTAKDIEDWAWRNNFQASFFWGTKLGYNYSVSCQVQKLETVLAQRPAPGTFIDNSRASTVWFETDC